MRRIYFIWGFLLLLTFSIKAYGVDTQIWNRDTFVKEIDEKWNLRLQTAFRWRDTSHFYWAFVQLYLDYNFSETLTITPSYRQNIQKGSSGPWVNSAQPMLDVTKIFSEGSFDFSNRSRFQYKTGSGEYFYRNRFQVTYPFRFDSFDLSLFLTEELFLLYFYKFNENRLGGGLELTVPSKVQFLFYYFFRNAKESGLWENSNVINLEAAFFF